VFPAQAVELWPDLDRDCREAMDALKPQQTGREQQTQQTDAADNPWVATGIVVDAEGRPIAGAVVRAHCGMGTLRQTGEATTDANGKYTLRFGPGILFADGTGVQAATISVHYPGHFEKNLHRQGDLLAAMSSTEESELWGKKSVDVFLPDQPKQIDFAMLPAARLKATVVDEDGKKLAGVRVSLTGSELPPSSSVVAQTTTDETGQFSFADIPTGLPYQLLIEPAKAESPWLAWASPAITFVHDETFAVHFQYSNEGHVVDFTAGMLYLQTVGEGVNWKSALELASEVPLEIKYDGLATADGTKVSAGMAWIELNKR
jgi:hypothetical protein